MNSLPMWLDELTGRLFFPCEVLFVVALIGLIACGLRCLTAALTAAPACHHDAEWMHRLANEVRDAASDKPKEP